MKQFRVIVNGNEYKVAIEELEEGAATPAVPKQLAQEKTSARVANPQVEATQPKIAASQPGASTNGSGNIVAAMPGTILDVLVNVGEAVTRGQALLVLEAMKMENDVMAPCDGIIGEIHAAKGASVNSGDLLMVLT